jgi:hypothetical protein
VHLKHHFRGQSVTAAIALERMQVAAHTSHNPNHAISNDSVISFATVCDAHNSLTVRMSAKNCAAKLCSVLRYGVANLHQASIWQCLNRISGRS